MPFESLSERLSKAMKNITGQGKLTEKNMNDMLKEVRLSLLEADVNYGVAQKFISRIRNKAMGQEVLESLNPSQMVVKIVRDELQRLLGPETAELNMAPVTTVMMTGLQGTGKTTASGKLAKMAKDKWKKNVLLVAADVIRPAAIEQLQTLGETVGVEVFTRGVETSALETVRQAMDYAQQTGKDFIILDTAGRLHIDDALMGELEAIKEEVNPTNILLTVDAMTGQDIITVADAFNRQLELDGLVVTKLDGDARGGALLSVRDITGMPIVFASTGEKMDDLEVFHPDRMAERILGMGDMLSLIEKAQSRLDEEAARKTTERMMNGIFTFNDMLDQYNQLEKMGSMQGMLKMIPGLNKIAKNIDDEKVNASTSKNRAIIQSMTPYEREYPKCLKASRKLRIAKGAGVKVVDVNRLINQLEQMQTMTRMMSGGNMESAMRSLSRGGGYGTSKHAGSKKPKTSKKKKKKK